MFSNPSRKQYNLNLIYKLTRTNKTFVNMNMSAWIVCTDLQYFMTILWKCKQKVAVLIWQDVIQGKNIFCFYLDSILLGLFESCVCQFTLLSLVFELSGCWLKIIGVDYYKGKLKRPHQFCKHNCCHETKIWEIKQIVHNKYVPV